jgi:hypothetical protein
MGLTRAWRAGASRAFGLGPLVNDRVFSNLFLMQKQFRKDLEIVLKAQKVFEKFHKILGKFPEIDWSMNNPSKVFGAHEKDFRAF